ncbi:hypothetical protein [Bradyrhizobium sp. LTSP857]|uniref:hypothetical protein n=1 Tax=Bradyrhizobium sp. LTSP857 TaxID=1619231 RepID=UPI0005D1D8D8|nr:hypothetical protein [Bradyrhizobium sp. LTSP857]KJC52112.1 hypothetical protein UP06_03510 [Bradyrhizobium sp. LTSP857]
MNKEEFEERASRLQEIGQIIEKLPIEIRGDAFGLLKAYATKNASSGNDPSQAEQYIASDDNGDADSNSSEGGLFSKHTHDKPADNVRLAAAHLFEQYGSEPFTAAEIESVATDAGITVPSRIDMTLRVAKDDGKQLFMSAGRGKFKPTVHGEIYLKNTYKVKKGTNTRSKANA